MPCRHIQCLWFCTLATMSTERSILRFKRVIPPAHYMMKIQPYSMLAKSGGDKYDSGFFKVGGHKWKLSLHPKGLEKTDKNGYISLYLAIVETDTYLPGWKVLVNFKLFIYDQIHDQYLIIQDAYGTVNRFHEMKKEWGFPHLISLEAFNNSSNGYLVDDCCVFGAEVCVIDKTHKCETLSLVKEPLNDVFTWKLKEFSTLKNCCYESQVFTIGERKWTLRFYPKMSSSADGLSSSLFLSQVDGSGMPPIFASYMLRILDIARDRRREILGEAWFGSSPGDKWGYKNFMPLKYLNEFVVNDTLTIEVQFLNLSAMKILPEWK